MRYVCGISSPPNVSFNAVSCGWSLTSQRVISKWRTIKEAIGDAGAILWVWHSERRDQSVMQALLLLQIAIWSVMQAPLLLQIAIRSVTQASLLLQIAIWSVMQALLLLQIAIWSVMQSPLLLQIAIWSVMQASLLQIAIRSVMQAPLLLQVAIPDVKEAAKGADILVFVLPHQFVRGVCNQLKGTLKEGTIAVTLIKVGSFYTLNKWEGGYIGIISPLLSPLSRLDHSMLLNEFGVGYIGITSPSLSPLSRLDHFTLHNEPGLGGAGVVGWCIGTTLRLLSPLPRLDYFTLLINGRGLHWNHLSIAVTLVKVGSFYDS